MAIHNSLDADNAFKSVRVTLKQSFIKSFLNVIYKKFCGLDRLRWKTDIKVKYF